MLMVDNRYYYTTVVCRDAKGVQTMVGPIAKAKLKRIADLKKDPLPNECRRVTWLCGDEASEAEFKRRGWFPD